MHAASMFVVILGAALMPSSSSAQIAELVRVSVDSVGGEGNGDSRTCALSADGQCVAFVSEASNLALGDGNGWTDVFVHDRTTGRTTRVSVSSTGQEGHAESVTPALSGDGRLVVFQSDASELVPGDTNGFADIFLHDRSTGTTTRVSVGAHDNQASLPCVEPAISADGSTVAFQSYATDLGGGQSIGIQDVFVRDLEAGTTTCISRGWQGDQANFSSWRASLTADGRQVAFYSQANNLVPNDKNGTHDVFVFDRDTGLTELVSLSSQGRPGNGPSLMCAISADGRYVAFTSYALNLVPDDQNTDSDVFVRDRLTGKTELVSQSTLGRLGDEESDFPAISGDGRYVVFHSHAENLVLDDDNLLEDVFVRDRQLGVTTRLSVGLHLIQGDSVSQCPAMAQSAPVVAFESHAKNLVSGDVNASADVFVHVMD